MKNHEEEEYCFPDVPELSVFKEWLLWFIIVITAILLISLSYKVNKENKIKNHVESN